MRWQNSCEYIHHQATTMNKQETPFVYVFVLALYTHLFHSIASSNDFNPVYSPYTYTIYIHFGVTAIDNVVRNVVVVVVVLCSTIYER